MKRRSYPITNIGSVSLLMILIVLCLVVFSSLSLSEALSDHKYSQKIAQHNTEYYLASTSATEMLKEIDQVLHTAYTQNPDHYYTAVTAGLASITSIQADLTPESLSITYEVPINDRQALKVVLSLNEPDQMQEGYYRITSWQEIPASTWNEDETRNLMTF